MAIWQLGEVVVVIDASQWVYPMWPKVEPMITEALEYAHGESSPEDIRAQIAARRAQLWIVMGRDTKKLYATAVTEVVVYHRFKALRIITLGGHKMAGWARDLDTELTRFCWRHGITRMEAAGRRGLVRRLEELAFQVAYTVVVKDVPPTAAGENDGQKRRKDDNDINHGDARMADTLREDDAGASKEALQPAGAEFLPWDSSGGGEPA